MKTKNLTQNEIDLLKRLVANRFADQSVFTSYAWTYDVLRNHADNATFGHLVTKGLVDVDDGAYRVSEAAKVHL